MDDATIDSDDDDVDDQSLTEEEATATAIIENDLKLSSLLKRKNELPLRTRNKFNALVFELLTKTKDDIHEMICDVYNIDDDDYQGLDSSRDTEAEVETAIRFFPEIITQTNDEDEEYPIQRLWNNVKSVSFILVLARLAIEFHSFNNHERGGLLIEDYDDDNTIRNLIYYFNFSSRTPDRSALILTLLIRLRRIGLFKKDDIRDYRLVSLVCRGGALSERGFQFLVEWDPTSLIQTDDGGCLPLHLAAPVRTSIREFTIIFNYVIRYYPYKKGIQLLFQKNAAGMTPFQTACQKYGRDVVMNVVEEILTRYHSEGTPLHIIAALMEAAADENVHLDCSYLLLRREPDLLVRLLLSGPHSNNNNDIDDGGGGSEGSGNHNDGYEVDDADHDEDGVGSDGGDDDNDDDDNNDGDGDIGKSKNNNRSGTRKRKRGGV